MGVRYFARINKEQVGPMSLSELLNAGIRPSTYVWTKGMADWMPASEVPDICRAMRRTLAGLDPDTGGERHDTGSAPSETERTEYGPDHLPSNRREMAEFLQQVMEEGEQNLQPDFNLPPQGVSIFMAVLATIVCFPVTGIVAIYFAWKCKADWDRSCQDGISQSDRQQLRIKAHDEARIYRMMLGITFCISIIMVGMVLSRTLF